MCRRKAPPDLSHVDVPPRGKVLQERILAVINEFAEENPAVPNALLLTGTGSPT